MAALTVFLSYAHEDAAPARKLYAALKAAGLAPWIDEENILPGQDWEREINHALRRSDFCILCLSKVAVAKRGFVQKEIQRALDKFEEFPEGSIYLIPARLDACEVPESLSRQQWVDLFQPNGMPKLLKALQYEATRRAGSSPQPAAAGTPASEMTVSITRGAKDQVRRLESAATRLDPYFKGITDGQHKLANVVGRMTQLSARWAGKIPDAEVLRRLEGMKRLADEAIAVMTQSLQIVRFSYYADPRIGIGPGNLSEALAAYRVTKAGRFGEAIGCILALRRLIQQQPWLAEFAPPLVQALDQMKGQIVLLQTQIGSLGEI